MQDTKLTARLQIPVNYMLTVKVSDAFQNLLHQQSRPLFGVKARVDELLSQVPAFAHLGHNKKCIVVFKKLCTKVERDNQAGVSEKTNT